MRSVVVAALLASGSCYLGPGYVQVAPPPIADPSVSPPPAVDVFYEPRPGYVYVNGRYAWENGVWAWQRGYYVPERTGNVFVQGYWANGRWIDSHWEVERPGYVHTDGGWEPRGRGYDWQPGAWVPAQEGRVYIRGSWVAGPGGTRRWERGRWEVRGGEP